MSLNGFLPSGSFAFEEPKKDVREQMIGDWIFNEEKSHAPDLIKALPKDLSFTFHVEKKLPQSYYRFYFVGKVFNLIEANQHTRIRKRYNQEKYVYLYHEITHQYFPIIEIVSHSEVRINYGEYELVFTKDLSKSAPKIQKKLDDAFDDGKLDAFIKEFLEYY